MDAAAADRRHTVATRTGAPWRDVPERYGPWDRVYDLFRRWQRDGTWARILTRLQAEADAKGLITWDVNVDSTVGRAHQHAAGAVKIGVGRARGAAGESLAAPLSLVGGAVRFRGRFPR
ncbi:transposase [Streptomyces sp. NPDC001389]|uniref:transposase n=1 Tax=Streptomyces sp. NPDC001389 TaxID=3364569 RepID=UPI0036C9E6AB